MALIPVRFVNPWGPHWAGSVAGFEPEVAARLIASGFAVKFEPEPESAKERRVVRLPLVDEYVKAGYAAENYAGFIANRTAEAQAAGFSVEIRPLTEAELEAERRELAELMPVLTVGTVDGSPIAAATTVNAAPLSLEGEGATAVFAAKVELQPPPVIALPAEPEPAPEPEPKKKRR